MKAVLKAPGSKRLKVNCDEALSDFAVKFNLRRYTTLKRDHVEPPADPGASDADEMGVGKRPRGAEDSGAAEAEADEGYDFQAGAFTRSHFSST